MGAQGPAALTPGKGAGTHRTGGWAGHMAGLDGCENLDLTGVRSPDLPVSKEPLVGQKARTIWC